MKTQYRALPHTGANVLPSLLLQLHYSTCLHNLFPNEQPHLNHFDNENTKPRGPFRDISQKPCVCKDSAVGLAPLQKFCYFCKTWKDEQTPKRPSIKYKRHEHSRIDWKCALCKCSSINQYVTFSPENVENHDSWHEVHLKIIRTGLCR